MVRWTRVLPAFLAVLPFAGAGLVALASHTAAPALAFDCSQPPEEEVTDLLTISPAPGGDGAVRGSAPLSVTVAIKGGVVSFPDNYVHTTFGWGDGSAPTTVAATNCGDGGAFWPAQVLSHTYTTPGGYTPSWTFTLASTNMTVPAGFVQVDAAAATPVPTPVPTAVPTPTAAGTTGPAPTAVAAEASPTTPPSPSPTSGSAASPTVTPTATAVAPGGAAAEPTSAPPVTAGTTKATPTVRPEKPPPSRRSEIVDSIAAPDEVSLEPDVAFTNLVLAGFTVWVLFSSVLLNQALQDNRAEVERRTAWLTRPWRRLAKGGRREIPAGRVLISAGVLVLTGAIYSVLEPGFGLNRPTATLFVSVMLGVGAATFLVSGIEAARTRRVVGVPAGVRPFPACIAIAIVSVAISRAADLQPGVMYGFIASCAVLGPADPSPRDQGRVAIAPVTASLLLTTGAWLLVWPLRTLATDSASWPLEVAEATAVVIFIGGIESLLLNMIPLSIMDGGKVFRWNRPAWAVITVVAAFLAWHVLLGRERAYFSGLREASSASVLIVFVAYTAASAGIWAYFRFRKTTPSAA